jgi:predicted TPR repeat methyltransferase
MYVGQVSRALAPYVAQLVGVDISPRMVEVYNTRASTQGLEPHEMRAVSSLAELQPQRFDLAVVRLILSFIPRVLIVCSSVRWPTTISLRSNKLRETSSDS